MTGIMESEVLAGLPVAPLLLLAGIAEKLRDAARAQVSSLSPS